MTGFQPYGRTIRVEGGIKAQSTRGAIGSSWWSRRFLAVLESFALGSRLSRGRNYARAGQVLSLDIRPGVVSSSVQGSRREPYAVSIRLAAFDAATWTRIEAALAAQALYLARLLAGEMPEQIEEVFAAAGSPLFPTRVDELTMSCSCPDWQVPCKHLAATFYLLAEAFDADPFQILHWRGRDRETLLSHLRELRGTPHRPVRGKGRAGRAKAGPPRASEEPGTGARPEQPAIGALAALADVASPELAETVSRFWLAPVPLPQRPPTLVTDVDLILRQLPAPDAALGGAALTERLRAFYAAFRPRPES